MASSNISKRTRALRACAVLAAKQHGLVTIQQAIDCGLSRSSVYRLVSSGQWRSVRSGVFAVGGVQPSWFQSLMAACLALDGVASGKAAGYLWAFDGVDSPPKLEVTVHRKKWASLRGVIVHRADWDPRWLTTYKRIPTTDPALTLLTLGAALPIEDLELALEDVLRRSAASLSRIRELIDGEGKGKPGCPKLRYLVEERDSDAKATDSGLETRIWTFLKKRGLPLPVRQYQVLSNGEFIARPDFAYVKEKIAIEGISWQYHSGAAALQHDRIRKKALEGAGWIVIDVTREDLRSRPKEVAEEIRLALESRSHAATT
jgi:very-short-patch-repair endonuclease